MEIPENDAIARLYSSIEKIEHLIDMDRYDLAQREVYQALKTTPDHPQLHLLLARIFLGQKQEQQAFDECQKVLKLNPESSRALAIMGIIRMEQNQHQQAEKFFLDALYLELENPYLYYIYARLMYKTGHLNKAKNLLEYALVLEPENENVHSLLSVVLAENKKFFRSRKHAVKSVKLSPTSDESHATLGYNYFVSGHPFKARYHLREALRTNPNDQGLEEMFLDADRATRILYLPMYYWSFLIGNIPGQQFTVWGIFIVLFYFLSAIKAPVIYIASVVIFYLSLVVYTWLIGPIISVWIKWRPPK